MMSPLPFPDRRGPGSRKPGRIPSPIVKVDSAPLAGSSTSTKPADSGNALNLHAHARRSLWGDGDARAGAPTPEHKEADDRGSSRACRRERARG